MERTCVADDCGRTLIPERDWRAMASAERAERTAAGQAQHRGRSLCNLHYQWARRYGTLESYKTCGRNSEGTTYRSIGGYTLAEILEEWEHLHDPWAALTVNCRNVGERLGIPPRALERRLFRAGVRSPLVPGGHMFKAAA